MMYIITFECAGGGGIDEANSKMLPPVIQIKQTIVSWCHRASVT